MRVALVRNSLSPRRPWTIRFEEQSIPVQWAAWYRQSWIWPSGDTYLMDMKDEITIRRDEEIVANRRRLGWRSDSGIIWEGIIPLSYTGHHCSVWFRGEAGELVMWARSRWWPGSHPLVIRDPIDDKMLPVLCGIAMATFLNYDG